MGCARMGADIWWLLAGRWPNGEWRGWSLLKKPWRRQIWCSPYLWHDSVGKYWARLVTCRFFGHIKLVNVNDPGEPLRMHCFRCERQPETQTVGQEQK